MSGPRTRQAYADVDRLGRRRATRRRPDAVVLRPRWADASNPGTRRLHFPVWILRAPEWQALGPGARYTFLTILAHASKKGGAKVAYSVLRAETGLGESTVIAAVAELERVGWLKVVREKVGPTENTVNVYQIGYPGEADLIRRAVERTRKDGAGQRQDPRVLPDDVYFSNTRKAWEIRKAFIQAWELSSIEWQSLATSTRALETMLTLRARMIAGTVTLSKLEIARCARPIRSKPLARTRVWESRRGLIGLGVLTVVAQGGPCRHVKNTYAACVPPSCAKWATYWIGSAPGAVEEHDNDDEAEAEREAPVALTFPGVRVSFRAGSKVAPDHLCVACARPASRARRHIHKPGGSVVGCAPRYCSGEHTEPVVAGCPDCAAPLADPAAMDATRAAWARGEDGPPVLRADAAEGDVTCGACGAVHRFAEAWSADLRLPNPEAPWLPLNAEQLVRAWLHARFDRRDPVPTEVALAERIIVELGDWWRARTRIVTDWKRLDSKDLRLLTGLAQRAGFGATPDTS